MPRLRVSLANKCQILFGAAVVLILVAALAVPWLRLQTLVEEGQRQTARRLADAWLEDLIQADGSRFGGILPAPAIGPVPPITPPAPAVAPANPDAAAAGAEDRSLRLRLIPQAELEIEAGRDPFLAAALSEFRTWANKIDAFKAVAEEDGSWSYRYARTVRQRDLDRARGGFKPDLPLTQVANPLRYVMLIDLQARWAESQLRLNRLYLAIAGLLAGLLAIAVFWFITTRIILSPVRVLRETADKVSEGDLNIRADINTGDEFEQLSDAFNTMLKTVKDGQDEMQALNQKLDLKLVELAESNLSLFEANRIKGEFLANVSHELKTPMNSIIGFAEVLADGPEPQNPADGEKRRRYVENILHSSRSLLRMITELLDLAKIEAGRMDLHVDRLAVDDACEGLLGLLKPQADRKGLHLELAVDKDLPMVETDPGKFQQIIFNFLSNAVKFTPEAGHIELGAQAIAASSGGEPAGVRVWVRDSGPGIAPEQQEIVFDKFRQLDSTHTREHGGAGLGLAISQELARLLSGEIELESRMGVGSTFSLVLPLRIEERTDALMPEVAS
ncbi:MAG: ATP-binding protein [Phycisphaerae bacterium]|nr:ATP-binding protein [Phycisphaerae bacterium]